MEALAAEFALAGIHLYRSDRVEFLVELLAEQLKQPGVDPLAPIEVVVGSRGMERHLRHALAERLGICANVEFPFPAAAVDAAINSEKSPVDAWSQGVLPWVILDVLPEVAAKPGNEPLARYLAEEADERVVHGRSYGLARRIAELFDRYVTYRPALAIDWSAGGASGSERLAGQTWQPSLWHALTKRLGEAVHRAQRLVAAFAAPPVASTSPMRVFALSGLAESWLEALAHISQTRDVELYLLCPSNVYWADLHKQLIDHPELTALTRDDVDAGIRDTASTETLGESGHPLLMSWGRVARDLQVLLARLPDENIARDHDLFLQPGPNPTHLHQLQDDIRDAIHPSLHANFSERVLHPNDRSLQFHDCHGPIRQVEVLRDILLGLLVDDPTLQPRDIVVMTPDIEAYAPAFSAVFDRGERAAQPDGTWDRSGTPRLPYEIIDQSLRQTNPVADALLRILAMGDARVTASEVLDLLALAPVSERFGFTPADIAKVRRWTLDAGIRWGVDAAHRAQHAQPEEPQNTWQFGLDRLLLGTVMRDDGREVAGIRPFEAAEGTEIRWIGAFCDFCALLFRHLQDLQRPRVLSDWVDALEHLLVDLTATSGKTAWLTRRVREELAVLRTDAETANQSRLVALDGLRAALEGRFEVPALTAQGGGGAIACCGMVPERAVPHRVVCLLGMDEGTFPRVSTRLAFDLMQYPPRVGDRDARDEDRFLLLEAVLSARDNFIVLFTGRDARTNEPRPPAVPVSELYDALNASWPDGSSSTAFTTVHPLQSFDAANFTLPEADVGAPRAFDKRLLAGANTALGPRVLAPAMLSLNTVAPPPEVATDVLEVEDLVRFWQQPVVSFLRQRVAVNLPWEEEDSGADREPIELQWLDHATLFRACLSQARERGDISVFRRQLAGAGSLPLGAMGDVAFQNVTVLTKQLVDSVTDLGWQIRGASVAVDVPLPGIRVVGHLDGATDLGWLNFAYGDESPRELLAAWIRLVAGATQQGGGSSHVLVAFGKLTGPGRVDTSLIQLACSNPRQILADLARYRVLGATEPLPFFVKTSYAFAKALLAADPPLPDADQQADALESGEWQAETAVAIDRAAHAAARAWKLEREKPYYRHAFTEDVPFADAQGHIDPRFVGLSWRIWAPILRARTKLKTPKAGGDV